MDGGQFDDISRKLAGRSTRRDAVRKGGLMAAVAGAFGVRSVAQAQDTTDKTFNCDWGLKALIVEGPNKGTTYEGLLKVTIERDGAIDKATLDTDEPKPFKVVGNSRGKYLSLRVILSKDEALALTGVGDRDIKSCQGTISGTLAGPEFGDIGVWEIVRRVQPGGLTTPTVVATGAAGGGGGAQPTPGGGGGGGQNPTPGPTSTACPPQDCGVTKMWDPQQCACVCYDNGVDCGPDTCCPATMICTGNGECGCAPGKIKCNAACHDACPPGQTFDDSSCTCVASLCSPGQKECGGVCKDVTNDRDNCGSCGNVCSTGVPCIAGTCTCPPTMKYCAAQTKCIDQNATC
jgi:hypothetical protein